MRGLYWMLQRGFIKPSGKRIDSTFLGCVLVSTFSVSVIVSAMLVFDSYVRFVYQSTLSLSPQITVVNMPKAGEEHSLGMSSNHLHALKFLQHQREVLACQSMVKFSAVVSLNRGMATNAHSATVIGLTPSHSARQVLPILDSIPIQVMSGFFKQEGKCIISTRVFPGAKVGDRVSIVYSSNRFDTDVFWILDAGLLPVPLIIVPCRSALRLKNNDKSDCVDALILRLSPGFDSKETTRHLQQTGNAAGQFRFVFLYWRNLFDQQFAVFAALRRLLLGVLSSLFLMAGLFMFASLDILLQRKRRQMAILLALGTTGHQIRIVFLGLAISIAISGLVFGSFGGLLFFSACPRIPIAKQLFQASGAVSLGVNVNATTAILVSVLALGTSIAATLLATRRLSHVDPIVDLKK